MAKIEKTKRARACMNIDTEYAQQKRNDGDGIDNETSINNLTISHDRSDENIPDIDSGQMEPLCAGSTTVHSRSGENSLKVSTEDISDSCGLGTSHMSTKNAESSHDD